MKTIPGNFAATLTAAGPCNLVAAAIGHDLRRLYGEAQAPPVPAEIDALLARLGQPAMMDAAPEPARA
jgi:hypothetical protein